MRYLSVCSGIEAASVAWHELGWQPVGFAEIEKFPSQVLAHRFPDVPNFGDMTKFKEWDIEPGTIDLLVGGTPCQAFSVAGLRKGLADPRGNLALTFVAMVDHYRPEWVVWENVPGVLSSNGGRDFGSFLGALGELGYGWAYRILDAQYHGVAQRRRRVFLVGHSSGDPRRCAEVLFEPESLRGDSPPSREARQAVASGAGGSTPASGRWPAEVTCTLAACYGQKQGLEDQHVFGGASLFVPAPVCMSSGQVNMAIAEDMAHTLNATNEQQAIAYTGTGIHPEVVNAITASMANSCLGHNKDENVIAIDALNQCLTGQVSKTIAARNDQDTASLVAQPSLYESHPNDSRVTGPVEQCPTVSARWGTGGNNTPLVTDGEASAFSWQCRGDMRGMVPRPTAQLQRCQIEAVMVPDVAHTLRGEAAGSRVSDAVVQSGQPSNTRLQVFQQNTRDEVRFVGGDGQVAGALAAESGMKQTNYILSTEQLQRCQIEAVMVPDVAHTLRGEGFDAGEDGTGRGTPIIPVQDAVQVQWASGGGQVENPTAQALRSNAEHNYQFVRQTMHVRRLTPVECERLQGFPDGWTDIRPNGKDTPDSPRYKALGNSMAVPVMRWIGIRIAEASGG